MKKISSEAQLSAIAEMQKVNENAKNRKTERIDAAQLVMVLPGAICLTLLVEARMYALAEQKLAYRVAAYVHTSAQLRRSSDCARLLL